ncbi:hypothetical protein FACS189494_07300 [Spirochaetia bacterium]|nr:hypothetical protein FACS189494_07300 [Spirochaetia bacterium]
MRSVQSMLNRPPRRKQRGITVLNRPANKIVPAKKKQLSIKTQFALYFAIFIVLTSSVITYLSLTQIKTLTTMVYNRMSLSIGEQAISLIDTAQFARLCKTLDSTDPYYEEARTKLLAFKRETDCRYLYTMAPSKFTTIPWKDKEFPWRFIIDGSVDPSESDFSSIGENEEVKAYEAAFWNCMITKKPQSGFLQHSAQWGWLITTFFPILDHQGNLLGVLGCDFDASELQQKLQFQFAIFLFSTIVLLVIAGVIYSSMIAEIDLQNSHLNELTTIAKAASDAKNNFLASTSHEIRTPLNTIMGMSELALRENISGLARDYVNRIRTAGNSLISIINDILDFSRIESGKIEIIRSEYNFTSLLNDVISIINLRLNEKPVSLVTNIDKDLPTIMIGDEARIRQVLLNVLNNAVKYTINGTITMGVKSTSIDTDDESLYSCEGLPYNVKNIIFEIKDTGIGIKPEDMKKLFESFSQFDLQRNHGVEGTGLGLAICWNLCRLMGGTINAESEYGKGSTFTVVLPQIEKDKNQIEPDKYTEHNPDNKNKFTWTAPSARVMVVDDISTNLTVAQGLLSPYKMKIDCTTNGLSAIELAEKNSYDMIFMDQMMPGMDGIEAVKRIRGIENEKHSGHTPIIALTANVITGMREMFLQNGFDDFISKPIEINMLTAIVEKWMPREKRQ